MALKIRKLKKVIDDIIIKQNTKFKVNDVRVDRRIECGSDHFLDDANLEMWKK